MCCKSRVPMEARTAACSFLPHDDFRDTQEKDLRFVDSP